MPYDSESLRSAERSSLRYAVLDLIARSEQGAVRGEAQFSDALSAIVASTRSPAEDLWYKYHGDRLDIRARVFARYGY